MYCISCAVLDMMLMYCSIAMLLRALVLFQEMLQGGSDMSHRETEMQYR